MNQSTLSWSATSNGVNSKSGRYFINFSFEAVCLRAQCVCVSAIGYRAGRGGLHEVGMRRHHERTPARLTFLYCPSALLLSHCTSGDQSQRKSASLSLSRLGLSSSRTEKNAARNPATRRTVTSPSNPTALVIASATCLIVISSFSPTVRSKQPSTSISLLVSISSQGRSTAEQSGGRSRIARERTGQDDRVNLGVLCTCTGRHAIGHDQRAFLDRAEPFRTAPARTFELPDEEFCEVARVDELPERGARSRDGEGRAVLCARTRARGGEKNDQKSASKKVGRIIFVGRPGENRIAQSDGIEGRGKGDT